MLLTRFLNFICCPRRQRQTPLTKTLVCYQRGGLTFATEVPGGPGGYLFLSDEECNSILIEVDMRMYTGEKIGYLEATQLQNSHAYQQVLADRNQAARAITPSFT